MKASYMKKIIELLTGDVALSDDMECIVQETLIKFNELSLPEKIEYLKNTKEWLKDHNKNGKNKIDFEFMERVAASARKFIKIVEKDFNQLKK